MCSRCCKLDGNNTEVVQVKGLAEEQEQLLDRESPKSMPMPYSNEILSDTAEFYVTLLKTPEIQNVGMDVDWGDQRTLRVAALRPGGLVEKWNSESGNKNHKILDEDRVVEINGVWGDAMKLLEQIRRAPVLVMKVRGKRDPALYQDSLRFQVRLAKTRDENIGLDLDWFGMQELRVAKVKEGLLQTWNSAPEHRREQVHESDVLKEVNGISGDALKMLDVIRTAPILTITFERSEEERRRIQLAEAEMERQQQLLAPAPTMALPPPQLTYGQPPAADQSQALMMQLQQQQQQQQLMMQLQQQLMQQQMIQKQLEDRLGQSQMLNSA